MQPTRLSAIAAWALLSTVVLTLGACSSPPRAGGTAQAGSGAGAASVAEPAYVALFRDGRYADALDEAAKAADGARGAARDRAALVAGLSAHALNRNSEAVRWLSPLERNNDSAISGKACATLGLIAQERGEHETAAAYLSRAAARLSGDESARASMYAGDSFRALQQPQRATEMYAQARERASDPALRVMIGDRIGGGAATASSGAGTGTSPQAGTPRGGAAASNTPPLTVQLGAYRDLRTAQQQAARIASRANTRIVPILRDGQRLYAVRVGRFTSREAAESVRRTVGGTAIVTIASGET